jgi:hypothetical protein
MVAAERASQLLADSVCVAGSFGKSSTPCFWSTSPAVAAGSVESTFGPLTPFQRIPRETVFTAPLKLCGMGYDLTRLLPRHRWSVLVVTPASLLSSLRLHCPMPDLPSREGT